jgi:glyoxylase I family protein
MRQDLDTHLGKIGKAAAVELRSKGVPVEEVRIDEGTQKKFVFFTDPNGQALELYEE